MLIDNKSFLELEYNLISKILANSKLLITSEIEVYKAANRWLNHNIEERSKYAEDLLLKVRLHLLSTETKRHLLKDSAFLTKYDGCVKILNKILECKVNCFYRSSSNYQTSRYCSQKYFKLLVCGGYNSETYVTYSNVSCIDVNKLGVVEAYPPMMTKRDVSKIVYLKGHIYAFGVLNKYYDWTKCIEKYSISTKTWCQVAEIYDHRRCFCVCSFIDKIFLTGGNKDGFKTNSCLQFNTSDCSWKEVATMNEARSNAACAVFEERIVVSGGWSNKEGVLNSVESYDVFPDKWSTM